jgi:formylglycine-generating enzyme
MKKLIITIILVGLASAAFAQVEVQNAVAAPGSGRVTISYDLVATVPCKITVIVSNDGGSSYGIYPTALSGDVGDQIAPGSGKEIIWTPAADTMAEGESYRIKIIARENPVQDDEHFASFVRVEGGTFHNGTSDVMLSSFYMDKYEITQAEYQAVMGTNPSSFSGTPNRPVEWVTWFNAIEYCNRRSMQEGFTPCYSYSTFGTDPDDWLSGWDTAWQNHINVSCDWSADGYRLPTEMEWMFAAMGGNQSLSYTYSGSDTITDVAWYRDNSYNMGSDHLDYGTHTVGTKSANELGTFDMSGNVFEWCWDIHGDYPSGSQTNPTGASSGSGRVLRGGSWNLYAGSCTVSSRNGSVATLTHLGVGFRILRVSP